MPACIYNTDPEWLESLRINKITTNANFWRKDRRNLSLNVGASFYFKVRGRLQIAGRGTFREQRELDIPTAWRLYGYANGVESEQSLRERAHEVLGIKADEPLNCILLDQIQLLKKEDYISISENLYAHGVMGPRYHDENHLMFLAEHIDQNALGFTYPEAALSAISMQLHDSGDFNPDNIESAIEYQMKAIAQRRGQKIFRDLLLEQYQFKCCVSGADAVGALEAAHIVPYFGEDTNHLQNGLLLRSDLHTLFDLGAWTLTTDYRVELSQKLRSTCYKDFEGVAIRLPNKKTCRPSIDAINYHRANRFVFGHATP